MAVKSREMLERAKEIAAVIMRAPEVHIYSHIDADGICGAAVAAETLSRAGIEHRVEFLKKMDDAAIQLIKDSNPPLAWFVDFGAGQLGSMKGLNVVITDHHIPSRPQPPKQSRGDLFAFAKPQDDVPMLNPHDFGMGSDDASGASVTYAVSREIDSKNIDLAAIAVVGAVADVQEAQFRRLKGFNCEVIKDGEMAGVLKASTDLRLFGRETRPLHKFLQYATDPAIPRLSGNEEACIAFLLEIGIDLKVDEEWRSWSSLDGGEKRRVVTELVTHMLQRGCGHKEVERLIGEVYTLLREEVGTPLRDAKEFGTLLNACGRYDEAEVGLMVCRGDRDEYYKKAIGLLQNHRETIVSSLDFVDGIGISQMGSIQYFHGEDKIKDTVVGVTAGMLLSSGAANKEMPIIAFAQAEDGIKVSARASKALEAKGLDLSVVMRQAAKMLGGEGGGHMSAAGATIPPGTEEEFLRIVERLVRAQIGEG
jgi:single-stranded-DNA-specific exonuclease